MTSQPIYPDHEPAPEAVITAPLDAGAVPSTDRRHGLYAVPDIVETPVVQRVDVMGPTGINLTRRREEYLAGIGLQTLRIYGGRKEAIRQWDSHAQQPVWLGSLGVDRPTYR